MSSRGWYLLGMLALLFLANLAMLMGMTNWPIRTREGFFSSTPTTVGGSPVNAVYLQGGVPALKKSPSSTSGDVMDDYNWQYKSSKSLSQGASFLKQMWENFDNPSEDKKDKKPGDDAGASDTFMDYLSAGSFGTAPIGSYDGMNMAAGLPPEAQGFRARMPNVPHPPGTTMLPFVNNVCKPECCGASLSCSGGCVCTTPEDRDLINTRGGNRVHDDGF